ncbi:MAG: helix-turn-helix transcriptional regulator [Bacteroidota bacterium]
MNKKHKSIAVNNFEGDHHSGISVEKLSLKDLPDFAGEDQPERHDRHSFHLLQMGSITIEIDFQKHEIKSPSIIYMHPNQVHRIVAFENVTVSSCAINNDNLNPEYLLMLEEIMPAKPMALDEQTFSILSEAMGIAIKLVDRKQDRLYHSMLKDSANTLVALVISQLLAQAKFTGKTTRFETVNKAFNQLLEKSYNTEKRPVAYAEKLNISVSYLNECVKNASGYSVSHHIQQRVILEAKRLLYHSDKSVKEIATELGYEDYSYFSRLFTKIVGRSAVAFRKNHD